jgi:hypothetical protein
VPRRWGDITSGWTTSGWTTSGWTTSSGHDDNGGNTTINWYKDWRRDGDGDEDGDGMSLPSLLSARDSGDNGCGDNDDDDGGGGGGGGGSGSGSGSGKPEKVGGDHERRCGRRGDDMTTTTTINYTGD